MKSILLIAHDYPPLNSIGAKRPASWFKYLHQFGYYPYLVTRHWNDNPTHIEDFFKPTEKQEIEFTKTDEGTLIRVPFNPNKRDRLILKHGMNTHVNYRKLLTFFDTHLKFITTAFDSTAAIYREAEKIIQQNNIDFIIATGEPWVNFRYAYLLHKKYNIPWTPDYRDCWNSSIFREEQGGLLKTWNNLFFGSREKKYAKSAACIIAANPQDIERLKNYLPFEKPYILVLNGYDGDVLARLEGVEQKSDKFRIAHAGTIYPFQKLELFLEGFLKFIEQNQLQPHQVEAVFYGGEYYPDQKKRLEAAPAALHPYLRVTPRIPYELVLKHLKEANLLLILANNEKLWLPAKLFESIGLGRRILAVENDRNVIEKYIKDCQAGDLCDGVDDVVEYLSKMYKEFLEKGKVESNGVGQERYTRESQAKRLADELPLG